MGRRRATLAHLGVKHNADAPSPTRQRVIRFLGFFITAICLAFFIEKLDLEATRKSFVEFSLGAGLLALSALFIDYGLRVLRWWYLLEAEKAGVRMTSCAPPFMAAVAMNNVLPLRLGDVVRALVFPASIGITRAASMATLIVERLLDLVAVLALMAVGLWIMGTKRVATSEAGSALVYLDELLFVAVGGLALLLAVSGPLARLLTASSSNSGRASRLAVGAARFMSNISATARLRRLLPAIVLSLVIWGFEALVFLIAALGLGIDVGVAGALFVMATSTLATLVPSSPGFLGTFHLAAMFGMEAVATPGAAAGAYAVVVHLVLWMPTTVVGLGLLLMNPKLRASFRLAATARVEKTTDVD